MLKSKIKTEARSQKPEAMKGRAKLPLRRRRSSAALPVSAFTLVEILVVVVLMALIVLSLMAVFNTTQAAFRASLTQTDVLEGGRNVMGLIKNDLESLTPSYMRATNFYVMVTNNFSQSLGSGSNQVCTYVVEDVFFITCENQTWKGVGYFVRTNFEVSSRVGVPGILYRFETNTSAADFARNPGGMYLAFRRLRPNPEGQPSLKSTTSLLPIGVSRILDGVMSFKVRAYNTNGVWMNTNSVVANGAITNVCAYPTNALTAGEPVLFYMVSNALPAAMGVELGVLEDRAIQRAESIGNLTVRANYLSQQAGKVHLFRQRFPIRNVDPSAYQ
jgi:hypothetical protein